MPTQANEITLDRDALYYPYIHVFDANWLKATLLCFPHVHRMVPFSFEIDDSEEIRSFQKMNGPRGEPLLINEPMSNSVKIAQSELLSRIQANHEYIFEQYSFARAASEYGDMNLLFTIYSEKMVSDLLNYLVKERFAALYPSQYGDWIYVHPQLGKAIMSTIAISIANDKGLDIVTNRTEIHHQVLAATTEGVFEELVGLRKSASESDLSDKVDDLAEIVMHSFFDVSKLTAQNIADLLKDGKDLRRFKNALIPIAKSIPAIENLDARDKRLKDASAEVIHEWEKYKKSLPRFALDAIFDATEVKFPEIASSIIAGASGTRLGIGSGLAIGLLTYSGIKIWRRFREQSTSPFQYLSRIEKYGATLTIPRA